MTDRKELSARGERGFFQCFLCGLFFLGASTMMEAAGLDLELVSEPAGALVRIEGRSLGATPLTTTLESLQEGDRLFLHLPGYQPIEEELPIAKGSFRAVYRLGEAPGVIEVNDLEDRQEPGDGFVSLREALAFARGDLHPLGADRATITGRIGIGRGDRIVLSESLKGNPRVIFIERTLPPLDDPGDTLEGPPEKWTLMPRVGHSEASRVGLTLGHDVRVSDTVLDGFQTALHVVGEGSSELLRSRLHPVQVGVRIEGDALLSCEDVRILDGRIPSLLGPGAVLEGSIDSASLDFSVPRVARDLAPPRSVLRLVGTLPLTHQPPKLFIRETSPVPLHQVPGITARASSYHYLSFFSPAFEQQWPHYAVDGGAASFSWMFQDPTNEWFEVDLDRPIRTSRLTVVHGSESLAGYRFSLLDHRRDVVLERIIEVSDSRDEIEIEPVDFQHIRIDELKVDSKSPSIVEIEADVVDSREHIALGASRHQVIFPVEEQEGRGIFRFDSTQVVLEDAALEEGTEVALGETAPSTESVPMEAWELEVSTGEPGFKADDGLSLEEAIAFLQGKRDLPAGEKLHARPRRGTLSRIHLKVDEALLSATLQVEDLPGLSIVGNPTRLILENESDTWLDSTGVDRLDLAHVSTAYSLRVTGTQALTVRHGDFSSMPGPAIISGAKQMLVAKCRFTNLPIAIDSTGETHVISSHFGKCETAILSKGAESRVVLDSTFEGCGGLIELHHSPDRQIPLCIFAGNRANLDGRFEVFLPPGWDPDLAALPFHFTGNQPLHLNLEKGRVQAQSTVRSLGMVEVGDGTASREVVHIRFEDPETRLVVYAGSTGSLSPPQVQNTSFGCFLVRSEGTGDATGDAPGDTFRDAPDGFGVAPGDAPGVAPGDAPADSPDDALDLAFGELPVHRVDASRGGPPSTRHVLWGVSPEGCSLPISLSRQGPAATAKVSEEDGGVTLVEVHIDKEEWIDLTEGDSPDPEEGGRKLPLSRWAIQTTVERHRLPDTRPLPARRETRISNAFSKQILARLGEGRPDLALATIELARRRWGDAVHLGARLIEVSEKMVEERERAGNWSEARQFLEALIERYRDNDGLEDLLWRHLHRRARDRFDAEDWQNAAEIYHEIVEMRKKDDIAFNNLGVALSREAAERAKNQDPDAIDGWITEMMTRYPRQAPKLRESVSVAVNNLVIQSIEKGGWEEAEAFLDLQVRVDDNQDRVAKNGTYLYQEWMRRKLTEEKLPAVLSWLRGKAERHPVMSDSVRKIGGILAGNEAIRLLGEKNYPEAFHLLVELLAYEKSENMENNLYFALQEWLNATLEKEGIGEALQAYEEARRALPASERVESTFLAVVQNRAVGEINAGRTLEGLDLARGLFEKYRSPKSEELLTYAAGHHASSVSGGGDPETLMEFWQDLMDRVPEASTLKKEASRSMNNLAIGRLDAKDYSGAVKIFRQGLSWKADDELLRKNLLVAYSNWSVSLLNAKKYKEGLEVLAEARRLFPDDPGLEQNEKYGRSRLGR